MHGKHTGTTWRVNAQVDDSNNLVPGTAGGWPYAITEDRPARDGEALQWLAYGIQDVDDAHVIAAAPALLAELKATLAELDGDDMAYDKRRASIRAAIAAAEGRTAATTHREG